MTFEEFEALKARAVALCERHDLTDSERAERMDLVCTVIDEAVRRMDMIRAEGTP